MRIPFRINTGYPWISNEAKKNSYKRGILAVKPPRERPPAEEIYASPPSSLDFHIDTKQGADKGFAYCYRKLTERFRDSEIAYDRKKNREYFSNTPKNLYIDGELKLSRIGRGMRAGLNFLFIEEDKYFFKQSNLRLHSLGARQDVR